MSWAAVLKREEHSATRASPHQASAKWGSILVAAWNSDSACVNSPRRKSTSPTSSCAAAESGSSARACCPNFHAVATPSLNSALRAVARVESTDAAHRADTNPRMAARSHQGLITEPLQTSLAYDECDERFQTYATEVGASSSTWPRDGNIQDHNKT